MDTNRLPGQVFCPNCNRINKPDAAKCWWCGHPLPVPPSQQPTMPYSVPGQGQGQGQSQQSQFTQPTQPVPPAQAFPPAAQYSQTQYQAAQAPTQRVAQPQSQPPTSGYSQTGPYGQQAAYAPSPPAAQVNVNRRPAWWLWGLIALVGLVLCAGLVAVLPGLPKFVPAQPTVTPTPQLAVVPGTATPSPTHARATVTSTPTAVLPTDTPAPPPTDTPAPPPTDTPTEIVVPTVTPVPPPTDTPEPAPTDTPEPVPTDTPAPPPPEPTGTYSASASADPPQPKSPNGVVSIIGRLVQGDRPVEGAAMRLIVHFDKAETTVDGPPTGPDGVSSQIVKIPKKFKGEDVDVDVIFLVNGQEVAYAATLFSPR